MNKPLRPFKDWTKKQWFQFLVLVLAALMVGTAIVFFSGYVIRISRDEGYRAAFENAISSLGFLDPFFS